jgi:uncharacterized sulfatase
MAKDSARTSSYVVRPEEELYDLKNDPYELNNLAADPKYQRIKKALKTKVEEFMKQQGDEGIQTEMKAYSRQPKNRTEE